MMVRGYDFNEPEGYLGNVGLIFTIMVRLDDTLEVLV
jgi:hypothetical protein